MKKHIRAVILFLILCAVVFVTFRPTCCYTSYIFPWERKAMMERAQNGDIDAFYHLYIYHKNWLKSDNDAMVLFLSKYIGQYNRHCDELHEGLISYSMPNKQEILEQYQAYCMIKSDGN
jgi:hypothetical protein